MELEMLPTASIERGFDSEIRTIANPMVVGDNPMSVMG
jgi:hypothetical protein